MRRCVYWSYIEWCSNESHQIIFVSSLFGLSIFPLSQAKKTRCIDVDAVSIELEWSVHMRRCVYWSYIEWCSNESHQIIFVSSLFGLSIFPLSQAKKTRCIDVDAVYLELGRVTYGAINALMAHVERTNDGNFFGGGPTLSGFPRVLAMYLQKNLTKATWRRGGRIERNWVGQKVHIRVGSSGHNERKCLRKVNLFTCETRDPRSCSFKKNTGDFEKKNSNTRVVPSSLISISSWQCDWHTETDI